MSKKRRKKKAIITLFFIIIMFSVILYFLLFKLKSKDSIAIAEIKNYGYTLEKRDTKLMQDTFYSLNEVLEKSEIDYEKYAEYLSKLFIIDLYTLNNKNSKYDVGGVEYIYSSHRDNYQLKVQDTLYKYLEEKSVRKQKLPIVSEINVSNIENSETYTANEVKYEAYSLNVKWQYEKDLGYDNAGNIILIKVDNMLYIAEFTPEVDEWKKY